MLCCMSILIMLLKYVLFFVKIVIGLYHYDQWGGKSGALSLQKTHHVKSIMSDLLVFERKSPSWQDVPCKLFSE